MQHWATDTPPRRDAITIPTIWVAVALSLLIHLAVMWRWLPEIKFPSLKPPPNDALVVRLSPPPGPPASAPVAPARPAPPPPSRQPKAAANRPARPTVQPAPAPAPVIAAKTPRPEAAPAVAPVPVPPATSAPAPAADLASYIQARRAARGDATPTAPQAPEDERTRNNRIAAANIAQRPLAFGYDPSKSGGIFELKRLGYSDAEFMFYGWNSEVRHNTAQLIEVSRGDTGDIRLAVVRKMIAIIRQYEQGDFEWTSQRLGRDVTLSARARDSAGLEQFMMQEFFFDQRPAR